MDGASLAGVIGIAGLFALLALRMPVAIALIVVGGVGIAVLNSTPAALSTLSAETFEFASTYNLMVIPLFVLMGNFATLSGMSRDLYAAAYAWVGHWRGGLASATIVGCAGFAALSGSSVASAVTMGRVALPEMKRYDYSPRLATGAVAAGGTLGILIPPSTGFVIYAILTEASIGRLFLAGVLPGLLLAGLFVVTIVVLTTWRPALGPARSAAKRRERALALLRASPIVGIIAVTIGGIYGGVFTAVEAAGVGALLAMIVAAARRSITRAGLSRALLQTVRTTAMSFLIIIGAHIFSPFLALSDIPNDLAGLLVGSGIGAAGVLLVVLATFILLGTFLEGFAMLVLAVPIVLPIVEKAGVPALLGIDPSNLVIWFGVVMVIVLEMGLISPPVGVNVFVVKGIAEDVPLKDIFAGILPFWVAMGVCLLLLVLFPEVALILPDTMLQAKPG
ncbi:MAG: TRAP transporter large permease [Alphaproteobacteria bacterium]